MKKTFILNSFIRCLIWVVVVGIFEVMDDRPHLSFQPLPAALKTYIHSIAAKRHNYLVDNRPIRSHTDYQRQPVETPIPKAQGADSWPRSHSRLCQGRSKSPRHMKDHGAHRSRN